ncbi:MAG: YgaC family protein [Thermomicrobiales bacterium]|nr:YgaC family protein [Thermomicrobiales bacterium]
MDCHRQQHANADQWERLTPGQRLSVVKLTPEGDEVTRYPATAIGHSASDDWLIVRAVWTHHRIELDGLVFAPGDALIEWFSPVLPFNAFAVLSPADELRGWYANVTFPAYLAPAEEGPGSPTLVWRDLYLDVIGLPDGRSFLCDEDELAASGLATTNPLLHAEIQAAAEDLRRRFRDGSLPFRLVPGVIKPEPLQP